MACRTRYLCSFSSLPSPIFVILGPIIRRALTREISIKTMGHIKCPYKGLLYEFARDLSVRSAYNMHLLRQMSYVQPFALSLHSGVTFLSNIRLNSLTFYRPSLDFPAAEPATSWIGHNRHRFRDVRFRGPNSKKFTKTRQHALNLNSLFEQSLNIPSTDIYINMQLISTWVFTF